MLEQIKRIWLSSGRGTYLLLLAAHLILLNAGYFFILFWGTGEYSIFTKADVYPVFFPLSLLGILLLLLGMTPCYRRRAVSKDGEDLALPTRLSLIALWIPAALFLALQTTVFLICSVTVPRFYVEPMTILRQGLSACLISAIFCLLCSFLHLVAAHPLWYWLGTLALHVAPMILGWGCYQIYNLHPFAEFEEFNPLTACALLRFTVASSSPPQWTLVTLGIVIGFAAVLWHLLRWKRDAILALLTSVYQVLTIAAIMLAAGVGFATLFHGEYSITVLSAVVLCGISALSIPLTLFVFRKRKPILHGVAMLLAVSVAIPALMGLIPLKAQEDATYVPNAEDVLRVEVSLSSTESFTVEGEGVAEILEIHKSLLELMEEGHLPDRSIRPWEEPSYVADVWTSIHFQYELKDGTSVWRSYDKLLDPAFDTIFLSVLKSNAYLEALQRIHILTDPAYDTRPYMRRYEGGKQTIYLELDKACVERLIQIYSEELVLATPSAFYEEYSEIILIGAYGYQDRVLYVPRSFTRSWEIDRILVEFMIENKKS